MFTIQDDQFKLEINHDNCFIYFTLRGDMFSNGVVYKDWVLSQLSMSFPIKTYEIISMVSNWARLFGFQTYKMEEKFFEYFEDNFLPDNLNSISEIPKKTPYRN